MTALLLHALAISNQAILSTPPPAPFVRGGVNASFLAACSIFSAARLTRGGGKKLNLELGVILEGGREGPKP